MIDNNSNIYNISPNADSGGDLLTGNPKKDEIIKNIKLTTITNMKALSPEERKDKFGLAGELNPMYNKHHTNETKAIMRKKALGRKPPQINKTYEEYYGEEKSNKLRQNISKIAKNRTSSKNSFFGKHHTEETKNKLREANKGKKPSNIRKVIINGEEYESITKASEILGVCKATILYRINSLKFDYRYK